MKSGVHYIAFSQAPPLRDISDLRTFPHFPISLPLHPLGTSKHTLTFVLHFPGTDTVHFPAIHRPLKSDTTRTYASSVCHTWLSRVLIIQWLLCLTSLQIPFACISTTSAWSLVMCLLSLDTHYFVSDHASQPHSWLTKGCFFFTLMLLP